MPGALLPEIALMAIFEFHAKHIMRYAITLFLLILCSNTDAQDFATEVSIKQIQAGHVGHKTQISARQVSFPLYDVLNYDIDTQQNEIAIVLKQTRTSRKDNLIIAAIDLRGGGVKWSRRSTANGFIITTEVVVEQLRNKTTRAYNRSDGKLRWDRKPAFIYADRKNAVGISQDGIGYDLNTGKDIWMRNLDHFTGWANVFMSDDTTLYITAAATLHKLNTKTSNGWKYIIREGYIPKPGDGEAAVIIGGVFFGLAGATMAAIANAATANDYHKFPSNILAYNNETYIVSDRKIACMAGDSAKWEIEAPIGFNAGSTLVVVGNELWVARPDDLEKIKKKTRKGPISNIPLFLFLNKETGQIKSRLPFDMTANFKDITLRGDTAFVLLKKGLLQIHTKDYKVLHQIDIDSTLTGNQHPAFFNTDAYYLSTKGNYALVNDVYPGNTFLAGKGDYVVRLDEQFRFRDSLHKTSFLKVQRQQNGLLYMNPIGDNNGTTLVKNGKYYGYIDAKDLTVFNNKIVCVTRNSINIIDAIPE
jgi:hypothetical protein